MLSRISLTAALLSAALLAACGGSETKTTETAAPPAAAPSAAAATGATGAPMAAMALTGTAGVAPAIADGATLRGTVRLDGPVPEMPVINTEGDPTCEETHNGPMKSEEVIAGPGGTLANVIVFIRPDGVKGSFPKPAAPVVLDQKGCRYQPHVQVSMVGQPVQIRNSDPTLHNVHGLCKTNDEFNIGQPEQGMVADHTFDKPEFPTAEGGKPVHFKCDVHGWMTGYLAVLPHPFWAVTGSDGSFTIANLPPGNYTVDAWQEKYGLQSQQITVAAKETKQVDFAFKP